MITGTTTNAAIANFQLPEVTARETPATTGFSEVYNNNPTQFATKAEADALAQLLGGKVNDLSQQWHGFKISPLYQVELPNGMSLNAGLLADRFRRYGTEAAMKMTEAELGLVPSSLPQPSSRLLSSALSPAAPSTNAGPSVSAVSLAPHVATTPVAAAYKLADPTGPRAAQSGEETKLASAARQFEAILIGTILKAATPDDGGGILSSKSDTSGQSVYQMAMENFAQLMSEQGGLGLADQVIKNLHPTSKGPGTKASSTA